MKKKINAFEYSLFFVCLFFPEKVPIIIDNLSPRQKIQEYAQNEWKGDTPKAQAIRNVSELVVFVFVFFPLLSSTPCC